MVLVGKCPKLSRRAARAVVSFGFRIFDYTIGQQVDGDAVFVGIGFIIFTGPLS